MPSSKELQKRISSINNTVKITKTMQLVSATRMKKAQELAVNSLPYSKAISEVISKIGKIDDYSSPYLKHQSKQTKTCVIAIGPSKGFVGSMVSQLQMEINSFFANQPTSDLIGIAINKKGQKALEGANIECMYTFSDKISGNNIESLKPIFSVILDGFLSFTYNNVFLAYTHFESIGKYYPRIIPLLPIEEIRPSEESVNATTNSIPAKFEPSKEEILDSLLKNYYEYTIVSSVMSSEAAEHASRMMAMKKATDNALELKKNLLSEYNKNRQEAITNQMLEIVGGGLINSNY